MSNKVYCKECKYLVLGIYIMEKYDPTSISYAGDKWCNKTLNLLKHPEQERVCTKDLNIRTVKDESWYESTSSQVLNIMYDPRVQNQKNNCIYFESAGGMTGGKTAAEWKELQEAQPGH